LPIGCGNRNLLIRVRGGKTCVPFGANGLRSRLRQARLALDEQQIGGCLSSWLRSDFLSPRRYRISRLGVDGHRRSCLRITASHFVAGFAVEALRRQEHFVFVLGRVFVLSRIGQIVCPQNRKRPTIFSQPNNLFIDVAVVSRKPVAEIGGAGFASRVEHIARIAIEFRGWALSR